MWSRSAGWSSFLPSPPFRHRLSGRNTHNPQSGGGAGAAAADHNGATADNQPNDADASSGGGGAAASGPPSRGLSAREAALSRLAVERQTYDLLNTTTDTTSSTAAADGDLSLEDRFEISEAFGWSAAVE